MQSRHLNPEELAAERADHVHRGRRGPKSLQACPGETPARSIRHPDWPALQQLACERGISVGQLVRDAIYKVYGV